jgi:hypothetical protein
MNTIQNVEMEQALTAWNTTIERVDKFFLSLTPEEGTLEVAPGRNRLIYILGHLTVTHDRMLDLLDLGARLHPEFDAMFLSTPDKTIELPPFERVRGAWAEVNQKISQRIELFSSSDWVRRPTAVSSEGIAKDGLREPWGSC